MSDDLSDHNLEQRDNALNKEIEKHPAEQSIDILVRDAKRRSRQLHILTAAVILTLLLGIGLSVVSYKLYQITQLAQSNRQAVIDNCEVANDSRKNQRELWAYVISLTPSQPRTEEQTARTEKFSDFVDRTFAQRDCQGEAAKIK